jgi:glyoxylate/hydroxypyruvate reductase A
VNILFLARLDEGERDEWLGHLRRAAPAWHWLDAAQARAAPESVQAALVANPPPGELQGYPRLSLIQSLWAGVDRLLADPTLPASVPLARMVDPAMSQAMAETALWAVLSLQRRFFDYQHQQRSLTWLPHPQRRADQVPVLVLGHGEMGRCAARVLARQGFTVTAWRRATTPARYGIGAAPIPEDRQDDRVRVVAGPLAPSLAQAQVLINLLPLTADTRGLLGADVFSALPRGAGVVNLGRGAHVVDADLLAALDCGQVGRAVLDVFQVEPLPADHPYWRHPRVTLLPHVAAATDPQTAASIAVANLRAALHGQPVSHLVVRDRGY